MHLLYFYGKLIIITDKHFAKYMCKYVTKPEPSDLFDIQEADAYRRHIHARRLGTMELMLLLMGKKACRCSRSEEHTSELQSRLHLVCRLLLEKKKTHSYRTASTSHSPTPSATTTA